MPQMIRCSNTPFYIKDRENTFEEKKSCTNCLSSRDHLNRCSINVAKIGGKNKQLVLSGFTKGFNMNRNTNGW